MTIFLDRLASIFAALFTLAVCGVPAWYTHIAIKFYLAPTWIYVAVAGLAGIGLILAYAFLRKAVRGIAPSRQRVRR